MKKVIRKSVFETNSSAVHSLVICRDGLEQSNLPVDEKGYILTDFGNFGDYDMHMVTFDQAAKLSYLATECYYINSWDKNIEDSDVWENICEAICDYTGASGIKIIGNVEPSLNHQVQPEYDLKFCNAYDDASIVNFVFNKYVGIKMTHD